MKPAKLPDELTEPRPRHVSDLAPGETAVTVFTALRVAVNGDCFLRLNTKLVSADDLSGMEVRRDEEGHYHVTVQRGIKYKPGDMPPSEGDVAVATEERFARAIIPREIACSRRSVPGYKTAIGKPAWHHAVVITVFRRCR
jgi:hypothetical protein